MLRIERKIKLTTDEAIKRAIEYFGPGGLGLEITDQGSCCVTFAGGGGEIVVSVSSEQSGTSVEVESREWDYQAKEFLGKVGG